VPLLTTAINDRHVSHRHGFRLAAGFYHVWGALLEAYHKLHPKPKSISKLKEALQAIWDNLPQEPINKAVRSFTL